MIAVTPVAPMHFYDTRAHAIACGVRGFEERSTKHPRSVTCRACVAILRERPAAGPAVGLEPAGAAP
jgi:hypothetical protein